LFSADHLHPFARDNSLPLPIGYRRSQPTLPGGGNFPVAAAREQLWKEGNASLGLPSMTSVDSKVDEELARAIEDELKTGNSNVSYLLM